MSERSLEEYSVEEVLGLLKDNVSAVILADAKLNRYRSLIRRNVFTELIDETGEYYDLIHKLWFHMSESNGKITDEYNAFVSYYGDFKGKYSRKVKVFSENSDNSYVVQLMVYPIRESSKYIFVINELDEESVQEFMTTDKVDTIQSTFLFSMYVDLVQDTTSSISVTEISDEVVNANIKYSEWRMMTVNMIWPEDKEQFLKITDPSYLRENLAPGRTSTFDCLMQNLEGEFIWVKLIFSRAKTTNNEDFRFVFMVQNIHEHSMELMSTLKKYEELALNDPLTGILNHGGIKTEINNAVDNHNRDGITASLMMIDLDFFKAVNDTYGHSAGDLVLKSFADLIRESFADADTSTGRWGGEEFVVVFRGKTCGETADLAEELRKKVENHRFPKAGHLTCSIGVARIKDGDTFEAAFDRVDKTLYSSKESGRNKVTLCE